jgi:glycosyltransferase involved in cell wall biosynthesis
VAVAPYMESFLSALNRNGLPTVLLQPTTKLLFFTRNNASLPRTRGFLVSPRFLLDLVRADTPFVLCSEYGVETFLTLIVAKIIRKRTLVFQEHVGRKGLPMSQVDVLYRRLIGRLSDGFVANTGAAKAEIIRLVGVRPERVSQVTLLVPPDREELCQESTTIEPPRYRPLFLYLGRLTVLKNVETLLRAAHLLQAEGLEFEVWIGGQGPDGQRLRDLTDQLGLDHAVRFIGSVPYPSIGHVYEACDVFVMPSKSDYRSVAVLEAMRFGKPVIDSAFDGNARDSTRDRFNALIFDPADPRQLAHCMREFIVTPDLALVMGARSNSMMEKHTPDSAALALIAILRRMRPAGE